MERPKKQLIIDIAALIVAVVLLCLYFFLWYHPEVESTPALDQAEELMEAHPDSALSELNQINTESLKSQALKARYALLKTQAVDRNYIDTTDFSILKPAIDFYLRKGTPEQKVKTLYYQARIYQNRQELDSALTTLLEAETFIDKTKDYWLGARIKQAQATLYFTATNYKEAATAHVGAANYFKEVEDFDQRLWCWQMGFEASLMDKNKSLVNCLLDSISKYYGNDDNIRRNLRIARLRSAFAFEDPEKVKQALPNRDIADSLDNEDKLCVATICCEVGRPDLGKYFFEAADSTELATSLQYYTLRPEVYLENGEYRTAAYAYKELVSRIDTLHTRIFDSELLFAKKKLGMEKDYQASVTEKNILWICVIGIPLILLCLIIDIGYRKKILKAKYTKSVNEVKDERAKNDLLTIENQKSKEEVRTLTLRIEDLEEESASWTELMNSNVLLSQSVMDVVKERIGNLNLIWSSIISGQKYSFEELKALIYDNKEEFKKKNRLAHTASHPKFIDYLISKGLNEGEIETVCLMALGLNVKQVGAFNGNTRAYHNNVEIRKKLGINDSNVQLAPYIRNLLNSLT